MEQPLSLHQLLEQVAQTDGGLTHKHPCSLIGVGVGLERCRLFEITCVKLAISSGCQLNTWALCVVVARNINTIMGDRDPEHEPWMKLGEDGKQPYVQGRCTPAELLKKLTHSGRKKWESRFTAVIKEECGGLVVLVCKECEMNLSPANPSMTLARHTCPSAALAAARKRRASNADPSEQLQQEEEEEKWIALDSPSRRSTSRAFNNLQCQQPSSSSSTDFLQCTSSRQSAPSWMWTALA